MVKTLLKIISIQISNKKKTDDVTILKRVTAQVSIWPTSYLLFVVLEKVSGESAKRNIGNAQKYRPTETLGLYDHRGTIYIDERHVSMNKRRQPTIYRRAPQHHRLSDYSRDIVLPCQRGKNVDFRLRTRDTWGVRPV